MRKEKKNPVVLRQVWKDYDPSYRYVQKSKNGEKTYQRFVRVVCKDRRVKFTPELITNGIKFLIANYAKLGYYVRGFRLGRRSFYQIGRDDPKTDDIPLYINVRTLKPFFQSAHIKKYKKKMPYILSLRLGALGIKTTTETVR